jgi:hypothetical protein
MKVTWFRCESCAWAGRPCVIGFPADEAATPARCPFRGADGAGVKSRWQPATGPASIDNIVAVQPCTIIIDGKTISISEESYQALKESLCRH